MSRYLLASIALLLSSSLLWSQNIGDTITIRTFNYSQTKGSGIRDTVIDFSILPEVSFEKVIMSYNMRCKDALVSPPVQGQTNLGCGEWDYSCNTFFHDPTKLDSIRSYYDQYTITNFSADTFKYSLTPIHDYYSYERTIRTLDAVNSEEVFPISTSNESEAIAIPSGNSGKILAIYSQSELLAAGFTAGPIQGLGLNFGEETNLENFEIRLLSSSTLDGKSFLESLDQFQRVYNNDTLVEAGLTKFYFHNDFQWDGESDLAVELSYTNPEGMDATTIESDGTSNSSFANLSDYHLDLNAGGMVEINSEDVQEITEEITIAFWANGNADYLPANTSLFYAENPESQRAVNIHFPWNNGRIYWDCGGDSDGYDRIEKDAANSSYAGNWNHWVFTKNTNSGEMNIYLNGTLWHSGSGNTKEINISRFVIGANMNGVNPFKGLLDEVAIWSRELSTEEIQNVATVGIDPSASETAEGMIAYYDFNETDTEICRNLGPGSDGSYNKQVFWRYTNGSNISNNLKPTELRPNIHLLRGDYEFSSKSQNYTIRTYRTPDFVTINEVVPVYGLPQSDSLKSSEPIKVWRNDPERLIDGSTGALIEEYPKEADGTYINDQLEYYQRWHSRFEVMSFVTPYGIRLDLGETGKTWEFDVTHMLPVFKGERRMTMEYGGQRQEDMDIRFHFIVGTPPSDVLSIDQMWRNQSRSYTAINNNQFFPPRRFDRHDNTDRMLVRSTITGHGQEGEFIPRNHHLAINGNREFTWREWMECSNNPVYPQGGTWVYDRAGWCPGMASDVEISDVTRFVEPGESVEIDYDVDVASGDSRYIVNHQLVQYGAPNHELDARILEVREPSNRVEFARFNSICSDPMIVIENTGSQTLTSATIEYWINDSEQRESYEWTGSLDFMESEAIILPSPESLWQSQTEEDNVFHARIVNPNGGVDEYSYNDLYSSQYTAADVLPSIMTMEFRTNAAPHENSYQIVNSEGDVIVSRSSMSAYTLYKEELVLPIGCYNLIVNDTDQDGIEWWANNDGSGWVKFRNAQNSTILNFEKDFGHSINYNFSVTDPASVEEIAAINVSSYPNPTTDIIKLEVPGTTTEARIIISDAQGKIVIEKGLTDFIGNRIAEVDVSNLAKGFYAVRVETGATVIVSKFIKE